MVSYGFRHHSCSLLYRAFLHQLMYIISLGIEVGYDPTVYTTSEGEGMVELNIFVFSHPVTGTPRPFTLSVTTQDGTAGIC